jgi:hypothetical protein
MGDAATALCKLNWKLVSGPNLKVMTLGEAKGADLIRKDKVGKSIALPGIGMGDEEHYSSTDLDRSAISSMKFTEEW